MSARAPQDDAPKLGPNDPRYRAVIDRQFNKRYRARPDYVCVASSAEQVVRAVQQAVSERRRRDGWRAT